MSERTRIATRDDVDDISMRNEEPTRFASARWIVAAFSF